MSEPWYFSRYILGRDADDDTLRDYERAVAILAPVSSERDAQLLEFARKHVWSIGALDAALALVEPRSILRRRLLIMAAVIEASPRYVDRFLGCDRPPLYALAIAFVGVRALARLVLGTIVLRFV